MNLGSARPDEDRHETMLRYLGGALPPDAVLEFNTLLKTDSTARQEFAALLLQQVQLEEIGQEQKVPIAATISSKPGTGNAWFLPLWLAESFCRKPGSLYHLFARPQTVLTVAISVVICLGIAFYLFFPIEGTLKLLNPAAVSVTLLRDGSSLPANGQVSLQPGDLIVSGPLNGIDIQYGKEPTRLHLDAGTELKILPWNRGKRLELRHGKVEAIVARQRLFKSMVIATPQAQARVLGTRFTLSVTTNATRLEVTEGKVRFTRVADGAEVKVAAGRYAVAATNYELLAQPLTGRILREYWTNLLGDHYMSLLMAQPNFPEHPSGREYLKSFEAPSHWGHKYGARIRGYLHPPRTGDYTFWIAAGDMAELFLSPDENPGNRQQIAYASGEEAHEWTKQRPQQSSPVTLVAGRTYYIEALHKQGQPEDHLAVAWQGPGREREVIPGEFLSLFEPKK